MKTDPSSPEARADRSYYLRIALGYRTQQEFADYLGVEKATVSKWEHPDGKGKMGEESALKLGEDHGVPFEWLRSGKGQLPERLQRLYEKAQRAPPPFKDRRGAPLRRHRDD